MSAQTLEKESAQVKRCEFDSGIIRNSGKGHRAWVQSAAVAGIKLAALSMVFLVFATDSFAEQSKSPGEQISSDLQDAFYVGDLEQLRRKRVELARLVDELQDRAVLSRIHYLLGLAWRHEAWLSSKTNKQECFGKAIAHLKKSIELNHEDAGAHALVAHVYRSMIGLGNRDHDTVQKAIFHRDKAFVLAPADPRVLTMEGYALIAIPPTRGGNIAGGLACGFEAAGRYAFAKPNPADLGAAFNWYVVGLGFQKSKDDANAIKAYGKALELKPNWQAVKELVATLKNSK